MQGITIHLPHGFHVYVVFVFPSPAENKLFPKNLGISKPLPLRANRNNPSLQLHTNSQDTYAHWLDASWGDFR